MSTVSCLMRSATAVLLAAVLLNAIGCARAETRYYFAAADLDDKSDHPELTFYRVTVTGESFGTQSSLQQGFYSADALHQLFGEVSKPAPSDNKASSDTSAKISGGNGTFQLVFDPTTGTWTTRNDSLFTVFYGANADKMAEQVQAVADDASIANALQALIGGSITPTKAPNAAVTKLQQQATTDQNSASDLADALDGIVKEVNDKAQAQLTPQLLRLSLLAAANDVLSSLGQPRQNATGDPQNLDASFDAIDAAYAKLKASK